MKPRPMTAIDIWNADFSPEVTQLAKERILHSHNLVTRTDLKETKKLCLLLVRLLNPLEDLSADALALLMGITRQTLRKQRNEKAFIQVVNR